MSENSIRKKIVEGSVLFISILKWLFLAACIGIIVGISTTVLLKVLGFSISTSARYPMHKDAQERSLKNLRR